MLIILIIKQNSHLQNQAEAGEYYPRIYNTAILYGIFTINIVQFHKNTVEKMTHYSISFIIHR